MINCAPIILFVYRRPELTLACLNSIKNNPLAKYSDLIVFSDGPKETSDIRKVQEVRNIIHDIIGFKSVKIHESEQNKGLANSIIDGVTKVIEQYGKAIVLEDDLVATTDFLSFMNDALKLYETNDLIWSVTGYSPPFQLPKDYKEDVYLSPRGCSSGWATWSDRWNKIDWEVSDFESLKQDKKRIRDFNSTGNDMFKLLELQMMSKIDSWAIRWCYSQFNQGQHTVYPRISKIYNDGFREGAANTMTRDSRREVVLSEDPIMLNKDVYPDDEVIKSFKRYYDLDFIATFGFFLRKYGGYKQASYLKKYLRN